jgi:hypothetical protein
MIDVEGYVWTASAVRWETAMTRGAADVARKTMAVLEREVSHLDRTCREKSLNVRFFVKRVKLSNKAEATCQQLVVSLPGRTTNSRKLSGNCHNLPDDFAIAMIA